MERFAAAAVSASLLSAGLTSAITASAVAATAHTPATIAQRRMPLRSSTVAGRWSSGSAGGGASA